MGANPSKETSRAALEELMKKANASSIPNSEGPTMGTVEAKLQMQSYMKMPLTDWPALLRKECGVYVFGEHYIAKRFDQINYRFCEVDEAKEVVVDNLYALLKNKYFVKINDEAFDRIKDIVKTFTTNLKSELIKVSFDENDDCEIMKRIPDYCIAFKNGVWNFRDNCWLFQYDITKIPGLSNRIYMYDSSYAIMWYMNYDFVSLDIDITTTPLEQFVGFWREIEDGLRKSENKLEKNYCFELMWNMCHDGLHRFSMDKFKHMCEVLGYLVNVSFLQYFILLIGGGRNGKNSLFDGCFSSRVVPMPTQNSMLTIETDKFIGGTLENKYHNIYLETNEKAVSLGSSDVLKQFTGSELQTAEHKGLERKSTLINCKHMFSANQQDNVKFGDVSEGFRRRINMFEVFFQYDPDLKYMKRNPDYYDTTFNQDLSEVKRNVLNTTVFCYFAMYGIMNATKKWTRAFKFSGNDWKDSYSDIDFDLKEKVLNISLDRLLKYLKSSQKTLDDCKYVFYDASTSKQVVLHNSNILKDFGYNGYENMIKMLENEEDRSAFFAENDVYMSIKIIQALTGDSQMQGNSYTNSFKKIFPHCVTSKLYNNKNYVLVRFEQGKLKVLSNR